VALESNYTQEQTEQIEFLINDCVRKRNDISKQEFKKEIENILNKQFVDYAPINRILEGFRSDYKMGVDGLIYKFVNRLLTME
jgi:hypothetical protein